MRRKRSGRGKTEWKHRWGSLFLVLSLLISVMPMRICAGEGQQIQTISMQENEGEHLQTTQGAASADLFLASQAAVLMEASTGTVIYEKNPTEQLRPASITKIMTLILIFDALESGKIHLEDEVTTSAHAKSMGGSQVFLEAVSYTHL